MYRTSTQEPRYKHSLYEREPRHVESREFSEESTSSSEEEEEESSGKYTEESDKETTESHESHSFQKRSEWSPVSPAFEHQWSYREKPEKYVTNSYICDDRILKQDKVTQKNLLSPFPSFLVPPIPRQVTGAPNYRLSNVRLLKEEQNDLKNAARFVAKKNKNYREEENMKCTIHKHHDCKERETGQKRKVLNDRLHEPKTCRPDRVLTCLHSENTVKPSRNFSKCKAEVEGFSKPLTSTSNRRLKPSTRENPNNQQAMTKFANCTLEQNTRGKSKRKTKIGTVPCEKETKIREAFLTRNVGDGKRENKRGGEVREKLVYVVEEEGKDVTKLETDLFTLNEILAIKRDLLELSEFAKKLKKLKEMKKESEDAKDKGNACQCKPAEELLKDVNRRIEILEARQEELERGSSKIGQKGDTETESKNMNDPKTSSDLLLKTPEMIQSSATTTVPSFPKSEMPVTRPEGLSNNSDIVNELMDIKTQLQKLEKRRMSKEVSSEAVPEGNAKSAANKNHAIAVFSSRTYILTSENFEKRKVEEKKREEGKRRNYFSLAEENTKNEQRKANVANWLKNVTVEQTETDVSVFLTTEKLKREESDPKEPKGNANVKYRNCTHALKVKNFENQEPQKNRELETDARKGSISFSNLLKNESSIREISRYVGYKKCMMTPSGRLFALMSESSEKVLKIPSLCKVTSPPGINSQRLQSNEIYRSHSSESVTSAIMAKQQVRRLKAQTRKDKRCKDLFLRASRSKSMQELNVSSSVCKSEKTVWNINLKNFGKIEGSPLPKEKRHKEDKNEFVKYLERHLMALKKNSEKRDPTTSSCTYSEFLASVNLDTEDTSAGVGPSALPKNLVSNEIFTYTASTKANQNALDSRDLQEGNCKERKKEKKKQKKKERKEKNKSVCKKKSKPIKEKKCREPKKQKKCKEKKKKEKKEGKHQCKCTCRHRQHSCTFDLVSSPSDSYVENDRQRHSRSCHCPTNQRLIYDFNSKRNYCRDDHLQRYREEMSMPHRPRVPSEDSLEIYRKKQQRERSKINSDFKKPAVDSFTIRNIFKNLGRYYPKISNFHLPPFGGEFCYKKRSLHTKSKLNTTRISEESEDEDEEEDEDDCEDVGDEYDEDCDETRSGSCAIRTLHNRKHLDHGHHHYYRHATEQDDLKNCRCVRVYLQTQEQRGWSGLGPFRTLSLESLTNASASTESGKSEKTIPLLPKRKSQIRYVGHSTQEYMTKNPKCKSKKKSKCKSKKEPKCKCKKKSKCKCKKEPKCKCKKEPKCKCKKESKCKCKKESKCKCKKESKCKCKKESKCKCKKESKCKCKKEPKCKCKKKSKKGKKHYNVCVCSRCGNVHKLKKKRKKCKCDDHEYSKTAEPETFPRNAQECSDTGVPIQSSPEKHSSETFPLLSFFTNFCKVKPRESRFSKCLANKMSEIRCLKTCPRVKTSFFSKLRNHLPLSCDHKSRSKHNSCHCMPRLQDIENRLGKLEKKESFYDRESDQKEEKKKEYEKSPRKMKIKCLCKDSSESKHSCRSVEFVCCKDEKKKKEKKPKKKKKHKKHKKKCCCSESNEGDQREENEEAAAYYYTIECSSPEAATSQTATTRTTEEEENEEEGEEEKFSRRTKSKERLEQKNSRLKEKLSSLTSFWKSLGKYKIEKKQRGVRNLEKIKNKKSVDLSESEAMFFDDYTKNGSRAEKRQVYEAKEEPMTLLEKFKKIKRLRKEKEKEKKEKKMLKSKAEKRSQK